MPGDPKECRRHAARCIEMADASENEVTKSTFVNLATMWVKLAEELERAKAMIDESKIEESKNEESKKP